MHKCIRCGHEITGNEAFCTGCGEKLYLCKVCGAPYTPGDRFCDECGAKLIADTPVQNTQVSSSSGNKTMLNTIIVVLVLACVALGGYKYYEKNVVIPREEAAAVEAAKKQAEAQQKIEEQQAKAKSKGVIVGSYVFIRQGPGKTYDTLGYFINGEEVKIIKVAEDWYQVERANGGQGWVFRDYCRTEE